MCRFLIVEKKSFKIKLHLIFLYSLDFISSPHHKMFNIFNVAGKRADIAG